MRTETVLFEKIKPPYIEWYGASPESNFGGETAKFLSESKNKARPLSYWN